MSIKSSEVPAPGSLDTQEDLRLPCDGFSCSTLAGIGILEVYNLWSKYTYCEGLFFRVWMRCRALCRVNAPDVKQVLTSCITIETTGQRTSYACI